MQSDDLPRLTIISKMILEKGHLWKKGMPDRIKKWKRKL